MEDVIRRIIKIEEKAREIIEGANQEKDLKRQEFDDQVQALEKRIIGDAKRKVAQIRERELNENASERVAQKQKCDEKLKLMEERSKENRELWVEELVENVLKR